MLCRRRGRTVPGTTGYDNNGVPLAPSSYVGGMGASWGTTLQTTDRSRVLARHRYARPCRLSPRVAVPLVRQLSSAATRLPRRGEGPLQPGPDQSLGPRLRRTGHASRRGWRGEPRRTGRWSRNGSRSPTVALAALCSDRRVDLWSSDTTDDVSVCVKLVLFFELDLRDL